MRKTAHSGANASESSSWKLEHSADDRRVAGRRSPTSDASGVPTFPATATGSPARPVDVADQLGHGRLAVRPRDRDEAVGQHPPRRLELADHRRARASRAAAITGASLGTPGALDDAAHARQQVDSVRIQDDFDARALQPLRLLGMTRVDSEDLLATLGERARDGGAGARQADNEIGPLGQGRARLGGRCAHASYLRRAPTSSSSCA